MGDGLTVGNPIKSYQNGFCKILLNIKHHALSKKKPAGTHKNASRQVFFIIIYFYSCNARSLLSLRIFK